MKKWINLSLNQNKISELVLSPNLTTIEDSAFNVNEISSIVIPSKVTSIGSSVFITQKRGSTRLLTSITVNMSENDWNNNVTKGTNWYDSSLNPTITFNP